MELPIKKFLISELSILAKLSFSVSSKTPPPCLSININLFSLIIGLNEIKLFGLKIFCFAKTFKLFTSNLIKESLVMCII